MTPDEIVAALDAISPGDAEGAHAEADELLLKAVPPEVLNAWIAARDRVGFWYA